MSEHDKHRQSVLRNIEDLGNDSELASLTSEWLNRSALRHYSYNFEWLGRPIIQYPADIVAVQELIWAVRPEVVIETGIAHGGSLILSASMLALIDLCDAITNGESIDARDSRRRIIGVDIDIRSHNRLAIEAHPLSSYITMIQGSSTDQKTVREVREEAAVGGTTMVFLDSNHTHEHVLAELEAYSPLVTAGSYCVVFDTVVEDMGASFFPDRPWGPGNNPKTAVWEFLGSHPEFEIDHDIERKLQITVAPDGYLRRIH